jgi:hypothetical protein
MSIVEPGRKMLNEINSYGMEGNKSDIWLSGATLSVQMILCISFVLAMPHLVVAVDFRVRAGDVAGLINAINMANMTAGSNRIILEAGVYTLRGVNNDTDGPNGLPSITNVLTISSSGGTAIIERAVDAPSFRILHISRALALFNITIRGGSANQGGGLFNRGRITFLFSSTVSGNRAARQGGGIFNSDNGGFLPGELVLFDSTIASNRTSGGGGGGILNQGGLSISNSTISMNESEANGTAAGGGILNTNVSRLTITNSTISNNTSGAGGGTGGGGISNGTGSTSTITNSTISGNSVPSGNGRGGGINNGGTLNLNNVTITNNTAQIEGGGINNVGSGTASLKNTIIAGNIDQGNSITASRSPDCVSTLMSQGFNLIGNTGLVPGTTVPRPPACVRVPPDAPGDQVGTESDPIAPRLARLALDPEGRTGTATHALCTAAGVPDPSCRAASPAIDAGNPAKPGSGGTACEVTDQRRFDRQTAGRCDIGAFEVGAELLPLLPMVVNDLVTFNRREDTFQTTTDPTGCPAGFVGKFSFEARLTNISSQALVDLEVEVTTLTGGNLLQNAERGPTGVGARLTVPREDGFADGLLGPGEAVDVPFVICLQAIEPFELLVDVLGTVP